MVVLFLDIDGVLNSEQWMLAQPETTNFIRALDPAAVALLAEIVVRAKARIVVSSSWRRMYSLTEIEDILVEAGFPVPCPIIGETPALNRRPDGTWYMRGHEIQEWLDNAAKDATWEKVEAFAILDDDSDMAHLRPQLVQTDFKTGLQRDHVERVVSMLTPKIYCKQCESTDIDIAALGHGTSSFSVDCRACGAAYAVP